MKTENNDVKPEVCFMVQGDTRPKRGGWAPGNYQCICSQCGKHFIGDKRAVTCSECAYDSQKQ